ncbi:DNA-binding response regulator [Endozoicomonas sp. OPT23]|uniref:response regulator n=1 Tax=Endozoicomonas sp. OPT23 TaxID=2072845 RepID=UPI00129AD47D|nr:response regulator [Endozoicomonas sp. OPT23]MRI32045.1 DNA-binding response regulator [Endozoicomonas sp. OPT23]
MSSENLEILLIDDDIELCELLIEYLATEGYSVNAVHDGEAGVHAALSGEYNLVLLDVTLPKLNGFDVLKKVRQTSDIPVLMLTARGDDVDRIIGLEFGADDYLPKPYNHRELVARIKAILRRGRTPAADTEQRVLSIDDINLNLANREAMIGGEILELTATEFMVLKALIEKAGELISRDDLTQIALNRRLTLYDRAIDMHVSNVRKKIGVRPDGSPRIKTVRGAGYFYIRP